MLMPMAVQWVDHGWTPDADQSCSIPLLLRGRENKIKGLWVKIRTGRDHSPKGTPLREINLFYCQSHQSTVMRNKPKC